MQGILIISKATSQIVLSSRLTAHAKQLAALVLDAIGSNAAATESVVWLPALPPPVDSQPDRRVTKKGKRRRLSSGSSSGSESYDGESSDSSFLDSLDQQDGNYLADTVTNVWANGNSNKQASGACCCIVRKNDLLFAIPVATDIDPVIPFAFLNSLISLLEDYFGNLSESTLKDSFDIVLQVLEETFSPPQPILTDASALRELVPPPSLYNKVMNAATSALSPSNNPANIASIAEARQVLASPIPWRRHGIRYQSQEVYMDVVEEVGGIVDVDGTLLVAEVRGLVEAKCRLSGMPDLLMTLTSSDLLQDCCFHPCVRLQKWNTSKAISFVPPDGKFILMEYRLAPPTSASVIPLSVNPMVTTGVAGGAFHWTISTSNPPSKPLEKIKLVFRLGLAATNVQATLTGGRPYNSSLHSNRDEDESPTGRYDFDAASGNLIWQISRLSSAEQPIIFQGTWSSNVTPCLCPSSAIRASFQASVINISGIQINSLKIAASVSDAGTPYKGSRPMMRSGRLDFRV